MGTIEIRKIGITDLDTDAIVNAANEGLQAGGGVCGAIFKVAGHGQLKAACNEIGHCDTGSAGLLISAITSRSLLIRTASVFVPPTSIPSLYICLTSSASFFNRNVIRITTKVSRPNKLNSCIRSP